VTLVDIVILALLVISMLGGFRQGFILMVAGILGAVVALGVARLEYGQVKHLLAQIAPHSSWLTVISYLLVFLVVWGAIILIARKVRLVARILLLGWLDRLGGAAIGIIQGLLVVELLVYLGKRVPNHTVRHAVNHSLLGPSFTHALPYIMHWFPHIAIPH
jgi:membrane protein required for colicin V production